LPIFNTGNWLTLLDLSLSLVLIGFERKASLDGCLNENKRLVTGEKAINGECIVSFEGVA